MSSLGQLGNLVDENSCKELDRSFMTFSYLLELKLILNNAKAILSFECTRLDFWGRKAGDRDGEQICQKDARGTYSKESVSGGGLGMEIGP